MSSVKLLLVVWNFPATIAQPFDMYYFYWPAREAVLRGWEAEVLTFRLHDKQPVEEVIDGIHVRRCPSGTRKGRPFSWSFLSALLTTDADIIYCHGYGEGRSEIAILLAHFCNHKVIFAPYFHAYPYPRPFRELYDKTLGRFFFQLSHRVVLSTDYTASLLRDLGVSDERLCIIPHVSRPEVFTHSASESERGSLLREAGITGKPLILGVGQLIERKGWEYVIRCLPILVEHFPDIKFLIIGPSKPAEPAFRERLWCLATELGITKVIQIVQDNSPAFICDAYRSATLLTHPSFVESFGLVLLEGMTAGLPIVANQATGIPCIVEDGVTGYIVDVRDTEAYTDRLLSLLNDQTMCQCMGAEGRRQAFTRYSQSEVATQLFTLFAEVLSM